MPNWISNQLTITGTKKTLVMVAETCRKTTSDGKIIPFSLDSIVPMPDILKQTENSTGTDLGLFALTGNTDISLKIFPDNPLHFKWVREKGITDVEGFRRHLEEHHPEFIEKAKISLQAHAETGCTDWHTWCMKHWGTKWDIADWFRTKVSKISDAQLYYKFLTANNPPLSALLSLAEKFPSIKMSLSYKDILMQQTGTAYFENGAMQWGWADASEDDRTPQHMVDPLPKQP